MSVSGGLRENTHPSIQKGLLSLSAIGGDLVDFARRISPRLVLSKGLKVEWHNSWNAKLDEALKELPEMEDCPHEIYRLLLQNRGRDVKPIALVTRHGEPSALIGLRREGFHWTLATQWLLPGALFPAKPGCWVETLEALGLDLSIGWWRQKSPPPEAKTIRVAEKTLTHCANCSYDFEKYWHETGFMKTIRKTRNRCHCFTFQVNVPGALEWTMRNWHEKWLGTPFESSTAGLDRLVLAQALQAQGKHITFSMEDNEKIIGGATLFIQQNDLVAGVCYREPEYDWHGVGDSMLEHLFTWAAQSPYDSIDIGGGQDYKKHWAPPCGQKWLIRFTPTYLYYPKQLYRRIRRINHSEENAPVA